MFFIVSEFIAVCLSDGTNTFSVTANVLSLFFCIVLPLGLPALDEETVVFDRYWISAMLCIMWLSVDGDEMDETSMSSWFNASSSTGLVGAFGFFFNCRSTLLYRAFRVIEIPINSKHLSFVV